MYSIYFEKKCITICQPKEQPLTSEIEAQCFTEENVNLQALTTVLKSPNSPQKIYIIADDVDAAYRKLCSQFIEVNAGGGLVENQNGEYLLIRRSGLWDLPKGHQERGEKIDATALREVWEETRLDDLVIDRLICATDHCYMRRGDWLLKHTWWYLMRHNSPAEPVPQREEGISQEIWVSAESLPDYLENAYFSVTEVFRSLTK